jgi:hypothetical protein
LLQRAATGRGGGGLRLSAGQLWRVWSLIGWTITLAALIVGLDWLRGYVEAHPAPAAIRTEWMNLPDWLLRDDTQWIRGEVEAAIADVAQQSIFDGPLTATLGEHLARSPWVAGVERITKQGDGTIRIWASFREPFAFVDVKGRAYAVDAAGVRLPLEYGVDFVEDSGHSIVTGVAGPIADVGQPWEGEDLKAGLALAKFLREAANRGEAPFRSSIRAIDVSNYDRRVNRMAGRLRLKTIHPGAFVEWGLPPGEEGGVEATAVQKLLNLRSVYVQMGGQLPAGRIDVRGVGGVEFQATPEPTRAPDQKSAPPSKTKPDQGRRKP